MSAGASRRLARLEQHVAPATDPRRLQRDTDYILERAFPFLAGWHVLAETMDRDHAERVEDVYRDSFRWVRWREDGPGELLFSPGHGSDDPLVEATNPLIRNGAYGRHYGPFVLPKAVSDLYVAGSPYPSEDCADCGYWYPRTVDRCPLCGGMVGPCAYQRKHGTKAPIYRLPADTLAGVRRVLAPRVRDWLQAD